VLPEYFFFSSLKSANINMGNAVGVHFHQTHRNIGTVQTFNNEQMEVFEPVVPSFRLKRPFVLSEHEIISTRRNSSEFDSMQLVKPILIYFNSENIEISNGSREKVDIIMYLHCGLYIQTYYVPYRNIVEISALRCDIGEEIRHIFLDYDAIEQMKNTLSRNRTNAEFIVDHLIVVMENSGDVADASIRRGSYKLCLTANVIDCMINRDGEDDRFSLLTAVSSSSKKFPYVNSVV
jgi:hypothetical protein